MGLKRRFLRLQGEAAVSAVLITLGFAFAGYAGEPSIQAQAPRANKVVTAIPAHASVAPLGNVATIVLYEAKKLPLCAKGFSKPGSIDGNLNCTGAPDGPCNAY